MTRHGAPVPAAGAVVVDEGRLLLIERGSGALAGTWTVPGGRQRMGEPLRHTARRETLEETGLEVEVGEPCWVGDVVDPTEPPRWHYTVVDFHARAVGGTLRAGGDASRAAWVPLEKVSDVVTTPSMRSLLAVLRSGMA